MENGKIFSIRKFQFRQQNWALSDDEVSEQNKICLGFVLKIQHM